MKANTIFNRLIKYIDYKHKLPVYIINLLENEGEVRWGECICLSKKLKSQETKLSVLLHEVGHIELNHYNSKKNNKTKDIEAEIFSIYIMLNLGFIEYLYKSVDYLKDNGAEQKRIEISMGLIKKKADKIIKIIKNKF